MTYTEPDRTVFLEIGCQTRSKTANILMPDIT